MGDRAKAIAEKLTSADRKALATRNGQGSYSTATWRRLMMNGLVDQCFCWTQLGYEVRDELGIRP